MKLEIKHLAPYLPYGLKMVHFDSQFKNGFEVHTLNGLFENYRYREEDLDDDDDKKLLTIKEITFWFNHSGLNSTAHNVKPILRPLSDLTDRINPVQHHTYLDGLSFSKIEFVEKAIHNETLFLCDYNYLIEYHFDVFGLIDKGLAIDINTLTE